MIDSGSPRNVTDVFGSIESVIGKTFPVLPGRLSFTVHRDEQHTKEVIAQDKQTFYFSSWMHEAYEGFCHDFGPVDLACVIRFCDFLREKLLDKRLQRRHLVYYCDADAAYFTNLAFLIGAFLVLIEKWSPEAAANQLATMDPSLIKPFRDATKGQQTFDLTLLDCLRGLARAVNSGFLKFSEFNVENYELLADPSVVDASVVCWKFVACRGPVARNAPTKHKLNGWELPPSAYIRIFEKLGVSGVVRLNEPDTYAKTEFQEHMFAHHDIYFEDMTVPTLRQVEQFLSVVDHEPGRVAVHCMAGLGRTGTMIACWIMRTYGWTAREAIAWLRIVRPGSVMGPQQHFLEWYEGTLQCREYPSCPQ